MAVIGWRRCSPCCGSGTAPGDSGERGGSGVALNEGRLMRLASDGSSQSAAALASQPDTIHVVSVIIPVLRDDDGVVEVHRAYRAAFDRAQEEIEFLYVLGRESRQALAGLMALKEAGEPLTLIVLNRWDGEGAALRSAFEHARGDRILILPASPQVDPRDVPQVLKLLAHADMVVANRLGLGNSWFDAVQLRLFRWLVRLLFGRIITDPVCRVRAYRRQALQEIVGYNVQQHYSSLLAAERGFQIAEVEVRPSPPPPCGAPRQRGLSLLLSRVRLTLEMLSLYVVLKFIHKPLRFFGTVGLPILLTGLIFTGYLGISRLFFGVPLADRPALILGVLLIVLGIQVIALGLIGEIMIFVAGKRIKDYTIDRIL
jgi:glycosyltransferase involved in cell wall biosynthesis